MSSGVEDTDFGLEAAEYVLGTLDADERAAFAERLKSDEMVQRAVAGWEHHFVGLGGRIDGIAPSPDVWTAIERALATSTATMHPFKVIPGGGQPSEGPVLRRSRDRWRTTALLSGALAAALALFVANQTLHVGQPAPRPADATYVAAVNRGGDKPALIVKVDLKSGQVLVRPVSAVAPEGHSLELWYIGTDKTPRSMGLVDKEPSRMTLPEGAASDAGTFAISVEPPGGSKSGSPTGPVVYSGQLVKE